MKTLVRKKKVEFCISLYPLYKKHQPDQLDTVLVWLMETARNHDSKWRRRREAVDLLIPRNFPQHEDKIYPLLIALANEPYVKDETGYNPQPYNECIRSLVRWPRARTQWKELSKLVKSIQSLPSIHRSIENYLIPLSLHCGEGAQNKMAEALEDQLLNSTGFVDGTINTIFRFNFRKCLPVFERIATLSPNEKQHERALMSQYVYPTGRHSYHAARHVRALWGEHDAETKAKLWAAKAIQEPNLFIMSADAPSSEFGYKLNAPGKILLDNLNTNEVIKKHFLVRLGNKEAYADFSKALIKAIEHAK